MKVSFSKTWKWILWAVAGLLVALILLDLCVALFSIYGWIHPKKEKWNASPADYGLDYYTFEVETENGTVCGWKIAAQTPMDADAEEWVYATEYSDKTVVFAPNYDSNRELLDLGGLDYVAELCAAGYNVITFDWTGSGFSDGTTNVFALEKAEELKAVVRFAAEETKSSFLAVQGVGFGCYAAAVAAAECDEVDALILDSCYEDFSQVLYGNYENWTAWSFAPFRETVRFLFPLVSGVKVNDITLADPINALNGKDVFLIQGTADELFGSESAKHLKTLAEIDNNTELWLVNDAFHLRARAQDSEAYLQKVSQFLASAYGEDHTT